MSEGHGRMGNDVVKDKQETSPKGQTVIDTHEKFMREASKQMVENLAQISKDVQAIKSWILLFGIIVILGLIVGGCNLILG